MEVRISCSAVTHVTAVHVSVHACIIHLLVNQAKLSDSVTDIM